MGHYGSLNCQKGIIQIVEAVNPTIIFINKIYPAKKDVSFMSIYTNC